jgi:hypothetical protein
VLLWAAGCVAVVVVAAATGLGGSAPAHALRQSGHWVYNSTIGAVVHVNGDSKHADGKVSLPGLGPANQVTQDDQHGYVIDRRNGRVVVFGKSSLAVESTLSVGTSERPDVLEVPGGPFLVYRQRGTIVRLGQPPASVATGGRLDTPIATTDGAVWVQRPDQRALCELAPRASTLTCPAIIPAGHQGTLTSLDDRPAFTDLSTGTIAPLTTQGLGPTAPLGPDLHAAAGQAHVADSDAGGRLPVLRAEPARGTRLVLVDTSTVGTGKPGAAPITVQLGSGQFDPPITSGGIVVVVNQSLGRIITYENTGRLKQSVRVAAGSGVLQVTRGEDGRVYIDNAAGTRTYEVDGSGTVTTVDDGDPAPAKSGPGPRPRPPVITPTVPPTPPTVAADGRNASACADGRCEVEVRVGTRIPLPARMRIADLAVSGLTATKISLTARLPSSGGSTVSCENTGCEMNASGSDVKIGLARNGVGTGNGLMLTVENIKHGSAIVKIEPAPSSTRSAHR